MYEYNAVVTKVVDGDTIDCDINLGFYMTAKIRLRLARINTPEVRGAEKVAGKAATEWLKSKLAEQDWAVRIKTGKTGKYGRWIAEIYQVDFDALAKNENDPYININDELVKNGHAEYTDYD